MAMTGRQMEDAIIIIASVLGSACFALIIWVITLQAGLSSLRKKVARVQKEAEDRRDELSKRGYQEYQGPSPQYYNARPEMHRQTSAQASMYQQDPLTRSSSMARGYSQPGGYDNSGYDRRPGNSYEGHGGVRVLPGGGGGGYNQQEQARDSRYNENLKAVGGFAKDVAVDVAKDVAKDEAKSAIKGWFN